jgi:hypothetical protein
MAHQNLMYWIHRTTFHYLFDVRKVYYAFQHPLPIYLFERNNEILWGATYKCQDADPNTRENYWCHTSGTQVLSNYIYIEPLSSCKFARMLSNTDRWSDSDKCGPIGKLNIVLDISSAIGKAPVSKFISL